MCLHPCASATRWYNLVLANWQCSVAGVNHRSGVVQAVRHRVSGLSTYGLKGVDEYLAYAPERHGILCLTFYLRSTRQPTDNWQQHEDAALRQTQREAVTCCNAV